MDSNLSYPLPDPIVNSPTTLAGLPQDLRRGLTAVSVLAFVSLVSSSALCIHLGYHLFTWKQRSQVRANQFVVLIFNLILADVQQSVAFVINARWVHGDGIVIGTWACWAQGWFVSTGDLSSGLFTFAIAVHSLSDIVFDYRLSHRMFRLALLGLWSFNYLCAVIGLAMHPADFYVRAGAWCWINMKYINERLWLHYFWIIIAEFGTLVIYAFIFMVLRRRVRESFYTTSVVQLRAYSAAKLIIAYPTIYVVCTLPLVIARLKSMAGIHVEFIELCVAAAVITSNGWLDVLLYSITRQNLIFGPDMTNENVRAIDTFITSNWRPDRMFGTITTIEATLPRRPLRARLSKAQDEEDGIIDNLRNSSRLSVRADTTIQVSVEMLDVDQLGMRRFSTIEEGAGEGGNADCIKGRLSFEMEATEER
ncbi:Putative G protein-coupled receptor GPR1 [Septoria linicola]|uniref:G protein-coupled receptor GPR1 n=1 Tax=Septoria linicola TaxID=215465 RepID=A0A9Q9AK89_9PEZI|nr:putative G protein-coupled receptor GPR1 [Septoria linicola]USW50932.1 Putative G protein-coupled receptor GPR1 [Septoria linicola]